MPCDKMLNRAERSHGTISLFSSDVADSETTQPATNVMSSSLPPRSHVGNLNFKCENQSSSNEYQRTHIQVGTEWSLVNWLLCVGTRTWNMNDKQSILDDVPVHFGMSAKRRSCIRITRSMVRRSYQRVSNRRSTCKHQHLENQR